MARSWARLPSVVTIEAFEAIGERVRPEFRSFIAAAGLQYRRDRKRVLLRSTRDHQPLIEVFALQNERGLLRSDSQRRMTRDAPKPLFFKPFEGDP